jgi:1-pyrroline-5-carboxylate dehydrogenase
MGLLPFENEPYIDWTDEGNVEKARTALRGVRNSFGGEYPLLIGGERVETDDGIVSINPSAPREVVGRLAKATKREADLALGSAAKSVDSWSKTAPEARARVLLRAAAILRRRRMELLAWEVYEAGKPWAEADADVAEAVDFLEYYAREMMRLKNGVPVYALPGEESRYFYKPLGVGVIVPPWNFPLAILTGMASAAIVTGNTVVLKPASPTGVVGAKFAEIMLEAGLPDGVLNFCPGAGGEIGDYLVDDKRVAFVSFTGSMATGLRINERAARQTQGQRWIKRVIAEMGGKDALIVDEGVDTDAAARDIVTSAFGYSGQKCSAASRAILHEAVHDEVLAKVVEMARRLSVAPPAEPETDMGPVIDEKAYEKILGYVDVGKSEGELLSGGNAGKPHGGYFISPTVFGGVDPHARIAQEEIFGPVLSVIKASSFDEALRIANDNPYGLTGGVYSNDRGHLERARWEFEAGNVYLNRKITGAMVGVQPFGGFRLSGTDSKAGGPDYLPLHMHAKTVVERF